MKSICLLDVEQVSAVTMDCFMVVFEGFNSVFCLSMD